MTCQYSLIDEARAKLQHYNIAIENVSMMCNCRNSMSILIPDYEDHCQAFKVSEVLIDGDLDYLHASLHLEPSLDQLDCRGCVHTEILQ